MIFNKSKNRFSYKSNLQILTKFKNRFSNFTKSKNRFWFSLSPKIYFHFHKVQKSIFIFTKSKIRSIEVQKLIFHIKPFKNRHYKWIFSKKLILHFHYLQKSFSHTKTYKNQIYKLFFFKNQFNISPIFKNWFRT